MKAVDYLKRFDHINNIVEYDRQKVMKIIDKLLIDFFLECAEIIKQREAKLDHAVISVIKEQDRKFHSLCIRLEKKYNTSVLKCTRVQNSEIIHFQIANELLNLIFSEKNIVAHWSGLLLKCWCTQ